MLAVIEQCELYKETVVKIELSLFPSFFLF